MLKVSSARLAKRTNAVWTSSFARNRCRSCVQNVTKYRGLVANTRPRRGGRRPKVRLTGNLYSALNKTAAVVATALRAVLLLKALVFSDRPQAGGYRELSILRPSAPQAHRASQRFPNS